MGDAVLHVRSQLQSLARENWSALEKRHALHVSHLRAELAQISRSLELKTRFDLSGPVAAPFPSSSDDVDVTRAHKKQKVEEQQAEKAAEPPGRRRSSYRGQIRLSMRLRAKPQYVQTAGEANKKSRKRPRPAEMLLTDPGKLKVAELRSELKKRGLRTSGLKAVLCDRLLDALEEEHTELGDIPQEQEESGEQDAEGDGAEKRTGETQAGDAARARSDEVAEDEIVRESVGSNKSPSSSQRSNVASPSAKGLAAQQESGESTVPKRENLNDDVDLVDEEVHTMDLVDEGNVVDHVDEEKHVVDLVDEEHSGGELYSSTARTEEAPLLHGADTDIIAGESAIVEVPTDPSSVQQKLTMHSSERTQVTQVTATTRAREAASSVLLSRSKPQVGVIPAASEKLKLARKSLQVSGSTELSSPLSWKRKSILRKASSLAPTTRDPSRKVSFAPTDLVNTIIESSQTDSIQPDPSPEKVPTLDAQTPQDDSKRARSESIPEAAEDGPQSVSTPVTVASSSVYPAAEPPAPVIPLNETEEERKKREFQESVAREAQRLRLAAKRSAQKRFEEAKATNAFWAKHDQLKKLALQTSSSEKFSRSITPSSSSSKSKADEQWSGAALQTPESSVSTESSSASSANVSELHDVSSKPRHATPNEVTDSSRSHTTPSATSASDEKLRSHDVSEATRIDAVRSIEKGSERAALLAPEEQDTSNFASAHEDQLHRPKAARSTYTVAANTDQVEEARSHKPTAKSIPPIGNSLTESTSTRLDTEMHSKQESLFPKQVPSVAPTITLEKDESETTKKADSRLMQTAAPPVNRDSIVSTVSSISEPSIVEAALKAGTAPAPSDGRRPLTNLVSGLHSFTTLLVKDTPSDSNARSAPVVNALKLAEKSRLLEEKKRQEKEKRKAALRKKLDEHKRAAALREKAEKDAQERREQERLNERKKREAELARRRQQRVKEMRAGLEKKRALVAAEKKSGLHTSKSAATTAPSAHHKHRRLASASDAAKPAPKPTSKPIPKPASKPVAKSAVKPVLKPAPKPVTTPVVSAKQAPKSHSPEIVNYEMSDNAESSDSDGSDSDSGRHGKKKVPKWAQKDHLNKILHSQFGKNAVDPSPSIFTDFVDTCDLEAIFEPTDVRKKKKFARRTSSGNWLADRPTARDRALYQRDMGYEQ